MVKFNHSNDNFVDALGIGVKRAKQLTVLTSKLARKGAKKSTVIEGIYNLKATPVEKLFCAMRFGQVTEMEKQANMMAMFAGSIMSCGCPKKPVAKAKKGKK